MVSVLKSIDEFCVSGKRFVFVDERKEADGELLADVGIFGSVRCVGVDGAWKLACGEK